MTISEMAMTSSATQPSRASVFSPLAKAVLDSFQEGVGVFDHEGRLTYANGLGQVILQSLRNGQPDDGGR